MKTIDARKAAPLATAEASAPVQATADKWEKMFHDDLAIDTAVEKRLLSREAWIVVLLMLFVLVREMMR